MCRRNPAHGCHAEDGDTLPESGDGTHTLALSFSACFADEDEDFGQAAPPLAVFLRDVLNKYPEGSQLKVLGEWSANSAHLAYAGTTSERRRRRSPARQIRV